MQRTARNHISFWRYTKGVFACSARILSHQFLLTSIIWCFLSNIQWNIIIAQNNLQLLWCHTQVLTYALVALDGIRQTNFKLRTSTILFCYVCHHVIRLHIRTHHTAFQIHRHCQCRQLANNRHGALPRAFDASDIIVDFRNSTVYRDTDHTRIIIGKPFSIIDDLLTVGKHIKGYSFIIIAVRQNFYDLINLGLVLT